MLRFTLTLPIYFLFPSRLVMIERNNIVKQILMAVLRERTKKLFTGGPNSRYEGRV